MGRSSGVDSGPQRAAASGGRRIRGQQGSPAASDPVAKLTARQREILQLLAEGHSAKEIARTLDISVRTVEFHRTNIMEKLNIHDTVNLVRHAIQRKTM
ncbi:MAG: response regulator transcription factor, partial [Syntrophobacteraceae bacterium]|nr:response regulator transcription factor [Syntrophobacteraceae bacterium]